MVFLSFCQPSAPRAWALGARGPCLRSMSPRCGPELCPHPHTPPSSRDFLLSRGPGQRHAPFCQAGRRSHAAHKGAWGRRQTDGRMPHYEPCNCSKGSRYGGIQQSLLPLQLGLSDLLPGLVRTCSPSRTADTTRSTLFIQHISDPVRFSALSSPVSPPCSPTPLTQWTSRLCGRSFPQV